MGRVPWNSQPLDEWARKHASGKFIDLGGHPMHYIEKGDGSPVILIHGFFYDTFMWHKNIDPLAALYKVYALDLWGFGYSTREPMDYGYPLYSRQLLEFMDALNLQKASMVGQSMGGGTIVTFAISHRDRVEKVILVDPAGMPNPFPLMGRIANLPLVGELMYGLNSNFMRKLALRKNFIRDPDYISCRALSSRRAIGIVQPSSCQFPFWCGRGYLTIRPADAARARQANVEALRRR